ncbi:MAG: hypothetical protein RR806_09215 [Oscillospiraceae bacterium]
MEKFIKEQTTGSYTTELANGINYRFYTTNDGWIAVIEMHPYQGMLPITQAKDRSKALSYIAMIEPVSIPAQVLC